MCVCVCVCVRQTHGQLYSSSYSPCLHRKIRLVSRNNALFFGSLCHKKGNSYNLIHNVYLSLGGGNKILSSFESFSPIFFFFFFPVSFFPSCVYVHVRANPLARVLCVTNMSSILFAPEPWPAVAMFIFLFVSFVWPISTIHGDIPRTEKERKVYFFCLSVV